MAEALVGALGGLGDPPVAVRSSASDEDTARASAAGQHETVLAARGAAEVAEAVRICWASAHSDRAADYRDGTPAPAMAVLVQRLVDAEVSGVLFTPAWPGGATVIEASWGLGPSVVGGTVTPDSYTVAADGTVARVAGDKRTRLDRDGGRLVTRDVPAAGRTRLTLTDDAARELADLGARAAALLGAPQDVEWAIAGGRVWLLQSRPITAAPPPRPAAAPPTPAIPPPPRPATAQAASPTTPTGTPATRPTGTPATAAQPGTPASTPTDSPATTPTVTPAATPVSTPATATQPGTPAATRAGIRAPTTPTGTPATATPAGRPATTLTGAPGSHGTATGPVRVVRGPADFARLRPGDVLVCRYTDPAWTPLLRLAAAVVTETGGVLSHAAIVARERRIPAVLGVAGATTRLRDGVTVTVDGDAGAVTVTTTRE